ncbi:MAG TPA: hypothetical protein PKD59_04775 [Miltoncostaeaceae bacterium]|nr:hypothetical protein [Miltoncostaeaceae bacterium]
MATAVTKSDLLRHPGEVARGLWAWQRGDGDDAVLKTLEASCGTLHDKVPVFWIWSGRTPLGDPAWLLPLTTGHARAFAPRHAARLLVAAINTAVDPLDADPGAIALRDWRGHVALVLPWLVEDVAADALAEVPALLAELPGDVPVDGPPVPLAPGDATGATGLARMARELHRHPIDVALALAAQGLPFDEDTHEPDLVPLLRAQGLGTAPPPTPEAAPSLRIEDDPCPRRRHARVVLQRMLRMGKVGPGYHTEFDHFARGAAAHDRRQALAVGEALIRAGMLIEKPSVGQRHISLNVRALPQIHALIERGETSDPQLVEMWTAPAPGASRRPRAGADP